MPEHAAVLGSVLPGTYCQTLSFGNFFIVLFLESKNSEDSSVFGRDLLAKIEDAVSQSPEISPKDLIRNYFSGLMAIESLHVVIAKQTGSQLELAMLGDIFVRLFRGGKIINLNSPSGFLSGPVLPNDLLMLATGSFLNLIPTTSIDPQLSPAEIRDLLAPEVENNSEQNGLAALFVRINKETPMPETEPQQTTFPTVSVANPKRRLLYGIFILLLIIISLISYQLRSKALDQKLKSSNEIQKQTQEDLLSANKLIGLNDILAREILLKTKSNLITKAEITFGKDWQTKKDPAISKVKELLNSLDIKISEVSHVNNTSLTIFSDLTLLRPNANISSASLVKNEIVLADSTNGSIYSVMADTKKANIITGSDNFKTLSFIDKNGDNFYLVNSSGIFSVNKQIAKSSDKWGNIAGLKFFAGNIYLLDPKANQIWKYQGTDLGFVDLVPYLKTGISVDLSRVIDFAIDGFVYVLSSTGSIVKFSGGSTQDFSITGLDAPLSNPSSIFSTDETKNIYILDGKRIVVLNKDGVYQAQYIFSQDLSKAIVLADETTKKIFLVSGSKIYSIDFK